MFASKTAESTTSHAASMLCSTCAAEFAEDGIYSEQEHRDNHQEPQHNAPNPLLVAVRECRKNCPEDCENALAWVEWLWENDRAEGDTVEHLDHARRVLTRLASFGGAL